MNFLVMQLILPNSLKKTLTSEAKMTDAESYCVNRTLTLSSHIKAVCGRNGPGWFTSRMEALYARIALHRIQPCQHGFNRVTILMPLSSLFTENRITKWGTLLAHISASHSSKSIYSIPASRVRIESLFSKASSLRPCTGLCAGCTCRAEPAPPAKNETAKAHFEYLMAKQD